MATSVLSRFAGLKIEDDDYAPSQSQKKVAKPTTAPAKKPDAPKKTKKPAATTQQPSANKKKNKRPVATEQQWELWKQKDEEMVNGAYQAELTEAILLSKLEFEQQKVISKQIKKQTETEKKTTEQTVAKEKPQKKQKKKNVMSLDQFNDMVGGDDKRLEVPPSEVPEEADAAPADSQFFSRVEDDAQQELRRDRYKERVIQRQTAPDEVINRIQFAEALEKKELEIAKLNDEVTRLKEELLTVKTRNKKLCNILAQGEMKEMAEALVEVEKLRQVQTELTAEVVSLCTQLEQERSRNLASRVKDKKKKEN